MAHGAVWWSDLSLDHLSVKTTPKNGQLSVKYRGAQLSLILPKCYTQFGVSESKFNPEELTMSLGGPNNVKEWQTFIDRMEEVASMFRKLISNELNKSLKDVAIAPIFKPSDEVTTVMINKMSCPFHFVSQVNGAMVKEEIEASHLVNKSCVLVPVVKLFGLWKQPTCWIVQKRLTHATLITVDDFYNTSPDCYLDAVERYHTDVQIMTPPEFKATCNSIKMPKEVDGVGSACNEVFTHVAHRSTVDGNATCSSECVRPRLTVEWGSYHPGCIIRLRNNRTLSNP